MNPSPVRKEQTSTLEATLCLHCGNTCVDTHWDFCCLGCESAYNFIHSQNLQDYYRWRTKSNERAYQASEHNYEDFDHPGILALYTKTQNTSKIEWNLYIEGIHCLACLWILEKIPEKLEHIQRASLDMENHSLNIVADKSQSLGELLNFIHSLGYKATPLKVDESSLEQIAKEKRNSVLKLGITGALTGNIMLMSASMYAGAESDTGLYFPLLAGIFCVGIVFYSATDFYKESIRAFKQSRFTVDYALSFAIIAGFVISCYHLWIDNPNTYFDSIAGLCFLILISRNILKYTQWRHLTRPNSASSFSPALVSVLKNNQWQKIMASELQAGERFLVNAGERVATDAIQQNGIASFDEAFLSGESEAKQKKEGSIVFAGSKLLSPKQVELICKDTQQNSDIFKNISSLQSTKRSYTRDSAEKSAKFLSILSVLFSFVSLFYYILHEQTQLGIESFLAILIITCPCAFALASPILYGRSLDYLNQLGLLIKDASIIEKISKIQDFYFDKTGTLTLDYFQVDKIETEASYTEEEIMQIIYDLEKSSKHPIAYSLRKFLFQKMPRLKARPGFVIQEEIGKGVSALYESDFYTFKNEAVDQNTNTRCPKKKLALYKNEERIASISMSNPIRPEARDLIKDLLSLNKKVHILSGDSSENIEWIAQELQINGLAKGDLSPQQKQDYVKGAPSVFIGDGANDSLALAASSVSIATQGSIDMAFQSAQVYLDRCELDKLQELIRVSTQLNQALKTNFYISLFYNISFLSLACLGYIHPLTAAVIMPLSSFLLVSKSLMASRYQSQLREQKETQQWKLLTS